MGDSKTVDTDSSGIANLAASALESKKGDNIAIHDVRDRSVVTDFYVVVSGFSPPHLKAMFNEVQQELKKAGARCYRKAGDPESGWLVLDFVDVIIHIFSDESRSYYAIEELWEQDPSEEVPQ